MERNTGKVDATAAANEQPAARGAALRTTFTGANEPELVAEHPLPGRHNYFVGDPSTWRSDVPLHGPPLGFSASQSTSRSSPEVSARGWVAAGRRRHASIDVRAR